MNPLIIDSKGDITPAITLDDVKGVFEITGSSHPEDAIQLYAPVFDWMSKYSENPNAEMTFNFYFQYFNSSSSKQIFKLISVLENIASKSKVKIRWHYDKEDTDMLSSGERFSKMCTIAFEYVSH